MAMLPVKKPPVPFVGMIPDGGLRIGCAIRIRAKIHGNRIQINLQNGSNHVDLAGSNPLDDVMIHVTIYPDNCIVRNHFDRNNGWGKEEVYNGCPVKHHKSFEIVISCDADYYRISINGKPHSTFVHRWPDTFARYISLNGTCTLSYIRIDSAFPVQSKVPIHHSHHPSTAPPPPYPGNY